MTGARWLALLGVLLCGLARAAEPLPASPTPHYIRDDAKWLSPGAFQLLNRKLEAFERETSSQIVVAIFPQIPAGEELFDFSQRLYHAWRPGQQGKDNGAIFLVFAADRKMRIHTGYGLEGVLPDARCKQIIEDVVAPQLRQGNREASINAGVDAMIAAAKGEYTGSGTTRLDSDGEAPSPALVLFILIVLVVLTIKFRRLSDVVYSETGPTMRGGGWGGGGFGGGGSSGGGFSGGGGRSGGGGASGGW